MVISAISASFLPDGCREGVALVCCSEVTATTGRPMAFANSATSTTVPLIPVELKMRNEIAGVDLELLQDDAREPGHLLEIEGLPQAVGPDDADVVGERQLGDGVEARVGADAREHLLGVHARVARAEDVHQPSVAGDGVGEDGAGLLDGRCLGAGHLLEHISSGGQPAIRSGQRALLLLAVIGPRGANRRRLPSMADPWSRSVGVVSTVRL